jgi:hypothetical protein
MSRSGEIARVAAELDTLLTALRVNVDALTAIIAPGDGKEPVPQ